MRSVKLLFLVSIILVSMVLICGCTKSKQVLIENPQQPKDLKIEMRYTIFTYEKAKQLWGYMDEKGKEIIKPQYEKVTDFSDKGIAVVYHNIPENFYEFDNKPVESGVIDTFGKQIIPIKSQIIKMLENGYIAISNENFKNTVVLNSSGETVFNKDDIKVNSFSEGIFVFEDTKSKKLGCLDEKGEIIVNTQYVSIYPFSNGKAKVLLDWNTSEQKKFIDKKGNVLPKELNSSATEAYSITPNPANQYERLWGIRDKNGKIILKPEYSEVTNIWNDVYLVVKDWNNYGLADGTGNFIINISDKPITYLGDGLVALSNKPESKQAARYLKNALYDLKTKKVTDYKFYFVYDDQWGYVESEKSIERLSVSDDKKSFVIDRSGNLIEGAKVVDGYFKVSFDGDITKVENQGKYDSSYNVNSYYDKSGNLLWSAPEHKVSVGKDAIIKTVVYQPSVTARIEYPQISGVKDSNVQEKINKRLLELFGLNQTKQENDYVSTFSEWFNITVSDNLLTVELILYSDSFGAHGNGFTTYKHFDINTGKEFSLKDLFKSNSNFKEKLSKIVSKQYNSRTDFQKEIDVKDDTDFYFLKDGIMIFYSQDMIASHAEGNIEVFIKFDEIRDILNNEADIFKLNDLEKYKKYDFNKKAKEDIERLIENYEYSMVDGINNNDFKLVDKYLAKNGPLYQQQQKLIESLNKQKITENIERIEILKIEGLADEKWQVIVNESIGVTKDNQKKVMDFTWKYIVVFDPEALKYYIYSLEKA